MVNGENAHFSTLMSARLGEVPAVSTPLPARPDGPSTASVAEAVLLPTTITSRRKVAPVAGPQRQPDDGAVAEMFGEVFDTPGPQFGLAALLLVSGCAAIAVALALDLAAVESPATGVRIPLLALELGFFLSGRYSLRERIGGTMHIVAATEVPLVLGLFGSRPIHVLGTAAAGLGVSVVLTRRRQRGERLRSTMLSLVEVAIVLEVVGRVAPDPYVLRSATWLAVLLTVLAVRFVRLAAIHLVGVLTHEHETMRSLIATTLVAMAACLCFASIALIATMVQTQSRLAVILVFIVCALPILSYRSYIVVRERFARLRLLQEYTASLSRGAGDQRTTSERAAEQVRMLLNAESGEITVSRGEIAVRAVAGNDDLRRAVPAPGDWLWNRIATTGRAVVLNVSTPGGDAQAYRISVGARDILAAPLMNGEEMLGVLAVRNRAQDFPTFSPSDCQLFATMADQTAVAVQAARLHERVQEGLRAKAHAAFVDPLTSLSSRFGLNVAIDELGPTRNGALLSLDLNGFKEINSTLGHELGDDVLILLGERIRAVVPKYSTVARLGGDEFAVFIPDVDEHGALILAERVLRAIRAAAALDAATLTLDAAIGVALIPEHGRDHALVMRRADLAMFEAKARGEKDPRVFVSDMETQSHRRVELLRELRSALADDEHRRSLALLGEPAPAGCGALSVAYQPKARLDNGVVDGVEALIRWNHPVLGQVPPDEFIGLAEQSGLIAPITEFVLRTSLRDCRAWRDRGLTAAVGVNISVQTLRRPDLLEWVADHPEAAGVAPDGLGFELTEREFVDEDPEIARALEELDGLGVGLSIDDFGAGYSSLGYLRRITANELKLDRALVMDVATDNDAAAIVTAVVAVAEQLGMTTVAEGVEDEATWARLHQLGVSVGQGYVLSRPLPIQALQAWMWERRNRAVDRRE